ncbi:MAG: hypothetical protein WC365_09455 [Candidatus Babeliales bacterium]|jgi:hypothetical protein
MTTTNQPKKSLTQQDIKWIAYWLKADADDVKRQLKEDGYIIQEASEDKKP